MRKNSVLASFGMEDNDVAIQPMDQAQVVEQDGILNSAMDATGEIEKEIADLQSFEAAAEKVEEIVEQQAVDLAAVQGQEAPTEVTVKVQNEETGETTEETVAEVSPETQPTVDQNSTPEQVEQAVAVAQENFAFAMGNLGCESFADVKESFRLQSSNVGFESRRLNPVMAMAVSHEGFKETLKKMKDAIVATIKKIYAKLKEWVQKIIPALRPVQQKLVEVSNRAKEMQKGNYKWKKEIKLDIQFLTAVNVATGKGNIDGGHLPEELSKWCDGVNNIFGGKALDGKSRLLTMSSVVNKIPEIDLGGEIGKKRVLAVATKIFWVSCEGSSTDAKYYKLESQAPSLEMKGYKEIENEFYSKGAKEALKMIVEMGEFVAKDKGKATQTIKKLEECAGNVIKSLDNTDASRIEDENAAKNVKTLLSVGNMFETDILAIAASYGQLPNIIYKGAVATLGKMEEEMQ